MDQVVQKYTQPKFWAKIVVKNFWWDESEEPQVACGFKWKRKEGGDIGRRRRRRRRTSMWRRRRWTRRGGGGEQGGRRGGEWRAKEGSVPLLGLQEIWGLLLRWEKKSYRESGQVFQWEKTCVRNVEEIKQGRKPNEQRLTAHRKPESYSADWMS